MVWGAGAFRPDGQDVGGWPLHDHVPEVGQHVSSFCSNATLKPIHASIHRAVRVEFHWGQGQVRLCWIGLALIMEVAARMGVAVLN